jgi:hypothetical protein
MTGHRPAPLELRDFITATRPDWNPLHIQQTIDRARGHGWAYEHFVGALWRTACDPDATPRDTDHMRPKTQPRHESWITSNEEDR